MKIYLEKEKKILNFKFEGKANQLLKKLKLNSEAVLVVKNNELINDEEILENNDEVKILSVISGG